MNRESDASRRPQPQSICREIIIDQRQEQQDIGYQQEANGNPKEHERGTRHFGVKAAPQLIANLSWLALLVGVILTMKVYWVAAIYKPKPKIVEG